MTDGPVYNHLVNSRAIHGGGLLLLIDPDRAPLHAVLALTEAAGECGVDALLVGSSFLLHADFSEVVRQVKLRATVPVIIFPGSHAQITRHADAVLFTSLISSRNATYLIEEQVKGAPLVKRFGIETIGTGYMLVESGSLTSVQYISGSLPIPRAKADLACAHALAAQYLGMRLVYLDAGSGAREAVPADMVAAVAENVEIPILVGGGLRTAEACSERIRAGASLVVVGTSVENNPRPDFLRELAAAVHQKEDTLV
jgi:putative glycerol-1-phosphate prenyltransferase